MLVHPLPLPVCLDQNSSNSVGHFEFFAIIRSPSDQPLVHVSVPGCLRRGKDLDILDLKGRVGEVVECLVEMLLECPAPGEAEDVECHDLGEVIKFATWFDRSIKFLVHAVGPSLIHVKDLLLLLAKVGIVQLRVTKVNNRSQSYATDVADGGGQNLHCFSGSSSSSTCPRLW